MIKLTSYADGHVEFHIDDVRYLPDVLRDLASMGYDLSKCRKALDEIEEEQRQKQEDLQKRKTIAVRYARRAEALKAMPEPAMRRFIIAYNRNKEDADIKVAEGTLYSDGSLSMATNTPWPLGPCHSLDAFKKRGDEFGYEYHIAYIDS